MQHEDTTLIAGITPYFLERGALWFEENAKSIQQKVKSDPWWREQTIFIEVEAKIAFSPFLRKLADLGYSKVSTIENRGEFAARGGIIDVFPINLEKPIRIEFVGNTIEGILTIPLAVSPEPIKARTAKDATEHERLWLSGLREGNFLVHIDHGIGAFRGFSTKDEIQNTNIDPPAGRAGILNKSKFQNQNSETRFEFRASDFELSGTGSEQFYILEYAAPRAGGMPDRLLVPRDQAKKLSRYVGFESPTVHRLGGSVWEATKRKAKEEAIKFAEELLKLYRERASASRTPYPRDPNVERELEHSFPYEETPDQTKALRDIHEDLSRERPMDRLLLGDVGFGKTEIAIRAGVRVAYGGKQVALLSPTTILADQHLATFRDRLKKLPIKVAMLTRLTPRRDIRGIIAGIENGEFDIVIGTHRILSKDIVWKNLGLAIIDEEQRFGVRHKETFKRLRAEVDVLSLSATPIPRTLSLALAKFRAISIIQTPPPSRLPIKTYVLPYSEKIASEAIAAELERKGQIFYLWNRIENIESIRRDLERLAPRAKIAVLHGRMHESAIIRVMHEFRQGAIDILLATTIIENGLDLPSVNTLVVANAARLGLSQAYQLRGRIGRGEKHASAYFLYPARSLTEKAKLRLRALKEAEGLGAGFQIALKDLEIRGAGNILGRQQSGTMNKVGLNLYSQLLNEALEELGEE